MNDLEKYLGLDEIVDTQDTIRLVVRLIFVLVCTGLVIKTYKRHHRSADHVFTYWLFSLVTFCLCFLLRKVPMELGFALGLFAVFGILRYRTESIAIRDLTYLFVVIGLALVNALSNKKISFAEVLIVDMAIVGSTYVLEALDPFSKHGSMSMVYDRVDLIGPNSREALLEDLRERTGLSVSRVDVQSVDLLRDTALVTVFYATDRGEPSAAFDKPVSERVATTESPAIERVTS